MKKRMIALTLILALAVAGLVGCTNTPAADTTDPSANAGTQGSSSAGNPTAGKTLSIALSENLVTLDPLDANNAPGYQPRNMCFDMLVESDHEGNYTPAWRKAGRFLRTARKSHFPCGRMSNGMTVRTLPLPMSFARSNV